MRLWMIGVFCAFSSACAAPKAGGPIVAEGVMSESIPPADPSLYRPVRDAKDWKNPYAVVQPDGVRLIAAGGERLLAAGDLERELRALPKSAWPYGRVIAAQEASIRSGEPGDEARIAANKTKLEEVLKALGLTVEWWPS
jgi:hypothetical protein